MNAARRWPKGRPRVRELIDFDLRLLRGMSAGLPLSERGLSDTIPLPPLFNPSERGGVSPPRLVGFDEVGRGSLAGPVTVACVQFDLGEPSARSVVEQLATAIPRLDDSKRMTPKQREETSARILALARWGVGHASAVEIDRLGIVAACHRAARRAYQHLGASADLALYDRGLSSASPTGEVDPPSIELTHGDTRSLHIAAASVVAKVARDALMIRLDARFPDYGLSRHKGYGTVAHRDTIRRCGPSLLHRRAFLTRVETTDCQSC